ncbi:MAG TPA: hypothetical protein VFG99_00175, partial [Chloroflexia bacterium]|nr:hypothetical protein [Chloroflexia bacterium]
ALFRKEWLHMRRLPPASLLIYAVVPVILGAAIVVALAVLGQSAPRIEILAPTTFFANLALIRTGTSVMRGNLAHLDFFAGWPISRLRLMLFGIIIGFGLPLISGELALVAALFAAPGVSAPLPWLILWPVLVAITALIALLDMQRLLKRWSSAPETLPDNSLGAVLIASLIWLAIEYLGN